MVEFDGAIYAMGGWADEDAHWSNEKFTPNSWAYIADQYNQNKIAVSCLAVQENTKDIWQIGGYEPGGDPWYKSYKNGIFKYYTAGNNWYKWGKTYSSKLKINTTILWH